MSTDDTAPRARRARYTKYCRHCGNPLTPGGVALACTRTGSVDIQLPPYCADTDCRRERDRAATGRATERGVITRDATP